MRYKAVTAGGGLLTRSSTDLLMPVTQGVAALMRGYPVWIQCVGPPRRQCKLVRSEQPERVRVEGDDEFSHVVRAFLRNNDQLEKA